VLTHEVTVILFLGIVVGVWLGRDYGASWDEYLHQTYARQTIEMYLGQRAPGDAISDLRFYGPAYGVPWLISKELLRHVLPTLNSVDAGHIIYWFSFLPAPVLLYLLCRRYVSRSASVAASLIFVTQPLIFGHAFVNPKDTPFMTAFMAAMLLGFVAVDTSAEGERLIPLSGMPAEAASLLDRILASWRAISSWKKVVLVCIWLAFALIALDLFLFQGSLRAMYGVVDRAYYGQAAWPVQPFFNAIAQDAYKTQLTAYLDKVRVFFAWARYLALVSALGVMLQASNKLLSLSISRHSFARSRILWIWLAAAVSLGLCSSIRVFGPFAGMLIAIYAFGRMGRRATIPVVGYGLVSASVFYATWPTLWGSPIRNLLATVVRMSRFPWQGRVLYESDSYSVTELPWHYPLISILIHLTIPAILLGALGLVVVLCRAEAVRGEQWEVAITLTWLFLPLAAAVIFHFQLYNAFRQLMFVIPPLLILNSVAFQSIFGLLRARSFRVLIVGITILPGIVGIIRLHPYEMIYFNQLVGGLPGAYGRFGLDTWGTTYRQVAEYIDGVAPKGSQILVPTKEFHMMTPFARDDLEIRHLSSDALRKSVPATYLVNDGSLADSFHAVTVFMIEREGIPLMEVQTLP